MSGAGPRAAVVRSLATMLGEGAVVTEPHELARYEKGWRYGSGTALAVVRPGSTEEVARVLAFASAQRHPRACPQGANTGLVGASTPDASGDMLVLSLERLSRTLEIDPVDRTVVAGGGVLLSQLDAALAEHGLHVPHRPRRRPHGGRHGRHQHRRARASCATATCARTCWGSRSCSPTAPCSTS